MSLIDEVKQKTDIVEVIGQYAKLVKAGRNFRALCPFHSEKRPSFFIYPEQQSWHCFGACNTGGDVFSFIMKKENMEFGDALRLLAEKAGVTIPARIEPDEGKDEKERLYKVNEAATLYFNNLLLNAPDGHKAREYVKGRGFNAETVKQFQLGYSLNNRQALIEYLTEKEYTIDEMVEAGLVFKTDDGNNVDRFRNKLMFPISDIKGKVIGFGARVLDESLPKYVNSPQTTTFDKSSNLYAINLASSEIRKQGQVVIVEGYMDVITAHQHGFTNVVASMGTAITEKQINVLKRLNRNINVVLSLDADAAGEEAMLRCVGYENILDSEIRVVILPEGKDPDDVIKEDTGIWQTVIEKSVPVIDYTFDIVTNKLDLTTARDKKTAVDKLGPIIIEIKDPIRKGHYIQKLARVAGVTERTVEAALAIKQPAGIKKRETKQKSIRNTVPIIQSNVLEEYTLALLLQHPEIKSIASDIRPEYFESSENRMIFITWQQTDNPSSVRDELDSTMWETFDKLVNREVPDNQIDQRYTDCVLNLRKKYLQNMEARKAEVLAIETEEGGTAAGLAKLEEQGTEIAVQLGEVFARKARKSHR